MKHLPFSLIIFTLFISPLEHISAQDWAELKHFEKANQSVGAAKPNEQRIILMGNSITIGWLQIHPEFFKGKPYINRGISGQTTPQMLLRFRSDVVALQPTIVVILAGTNDIAGNTGPTTLERIMDNIRSMTEIAQANNIKVVLCSVLPAFDYPWKPGMKPHIKIPALNAKIAAYAREKEVYYLDYFTALEDGNKGMKTAYASDGVHPTLEGYKVMESLLEKAIATLTTNKKE